RHLGRVERLAIVLDGENDIGCVAGDAGDDFSRTRVTRAMLDDIGHRLLDAQLKGEGRLAREPGRLAHPQDPFCHPRKLARMVAQGERRSVGSVRTIDHADCAAAGRTAAMAAARSNMMGMISSMPEVLRT